LGGGNRKLGDIHYPHHHVQKYKFFISFSIDDSQLDSLSKPSFEANEAN
jgi:hypothetical protein